MQNKTVLFLCLLMATSSSVFAQQGFEFGAQVMPQLTLIVNDDDFAAGDELNFRTTVNLAYGIHAAYNFNDHLGVQTGLLFSTQGQKYVSDEPTPDAYTSEKRMNYLKIPLLLKFNSNPEASAQFIATLGPQFGLLNKVTNYYNDEKITYTNLLGETRDIKDAYKSMDLGAVLSLGARFRLTDNLQLGTSFRFDYSLGDIEDKEATYSLFGLGNNLNYWSSDRASSHNATGGFMVDFTYHLGGN